jgi:hypothetical protein
MATVQPGQIAILPIQNQNGSQCQEPIVLGEGFERAHDGSSARNLAAVVGHLGMVEMLRNRSQAEMSVSHQRLLKHE